MVFNVQIIADPKAKDPQHASSPGWIPLGANNNSFLFRKAFLRILEIRESIGTGEPATGTILSGTLDFTLVHEFGHLLHLYDSNLWGWHWNLLRPMSDIMNEGWTVGQYNVDRIVGGVGKALHMRLPVRLCPKLEGLRA